MPRLTRNSSAAAMVLAVLCLTGCDVSRGNPQFGDSGRGARLVAGAGCGTCHAIPGVAGAYGQVGPSLAGIGDRAVIAGVLPNTPENMAKWIMSPQAIVPGNAMPNMELNDHDARDIVAFLYTLR